MVLYCFVLSQLDRSYPVLACIGLYDIVLHCLALSCPVLRWYYLVSPYRVSFCLDLSCIVLTFLTCWLTLTLCVIYSFDLSHFVIYGLVLYVLDWLQLYDIASSCIVSSCRVLS